MVNIYNSHILTGLYSIIIHTKLLYITLKINIKHIIKLLREKKLVFFPNYDHII